MKVALAQLNYTIGNFDGNFSKIEKAIEKAKIDKAELVVFSELCVCGYPPLDLLEQNEFIKNCAKTIDKIVACSKDIAVIIGSPTVNLDAHGKNLFNSAIFIEDGKLIKTIHKTLLPTYDVFDEYRYFEPNNHFETINVKGKKVALTICEDLWFQQPSDNPFSRAIIYKTEPIEQLSHLQPDLIINISASPFSYTQDFVRKQTMMDNAKEYKLPVIYVNQVGSQTELIFDGGSLYINENGEIVEELKYFEEDYVVVDLKESKPKIPGITEYSRVNYIQKIHDALILGIRDFFTKLGFSKATLGLSGGIDSAVTLGLAVEALGAENLRVLLLPSRYSSDHSISDAIGLAERLHVQYDIVKIQPILDAFIEQMADVFKGTKEDLTEENIQARIRGSLLMALSNKFGNILLNTSNKSEAAVGYGTLYGDMNGALSVLGDVYKTDVYRLARYINRNVEIIPENTIIKPPSAELRDNQKDSDSLPEYEILDNILKKYIELKMSEEEIAKHGFDPKVVRRVVGLINRNEFKRYQTPPILRISTKAFGSGRRMPIVAQY